MQKHITIGISDYCSIVARDPVHAQLITIEGTYQFEAIVTDDPNMVTSDDTLVFEAQDWLKLYDDDEVRYEVTATHTRIYRKDNLLLIIH